MKILSLIILTLSSSVFAYEYRASVSDKFNHRAIELKKVLTDFESFCQGCRYHLGGMKEIRVLKEQNGQFYLWSYVKDAKETRSFSKVTVKEYFDSSEIELSSTYPNKKEIGELNAETGLNHSSLFTEMDQTWNLKEIFVDGQFDHTVVTYEVVGQSNSRLLRMFKRKVLGKLRSAGIDYLTALK